MKPATRTSILRIIIPFMVILFITQTVTALSFVFEVRDRTLFQIHKYGGLILLGLIFIHIPLNWNWIVANYFKRKA
ncbi:MAG: hypothetical protein ACYC27_11705 [Armatimonadota bacterium]